MSTRLRCLEATIKRLEGSSRTLRRQRDACRVRLGLGKNIVNISVRLESIDACVRKVDKQVARACDKMDAARNALVSAGAGAVPGALVVAVAVVEGEGLLAGAGANDVNAAGDGRGGSQ
jgi:hypothetical protein